MGDIAARELKTVLANARISSAQKNEINENGLL